MTSYTMSGNKNEKVVVIGAGVGRTGTLSFKKAMDILGLGPCYHMEEVFKRKDAKFWEKISKGDDVDVHDVLGSKGYRSTSDFPSCCFWKEQLDRYPYAKVILTTRNPETWYKSCTDTIFKMIPCHPNTSLGVKIAQFFGLPTPGFYTMLPALFENKFLKGKGWSKKEVISSFIEHNNNVISTCPKDKLLVFEVAQGWKPLCDFLQVPVPDVPFPHVNDTKEFQKHVQFANVVGYAIPIVLGMVVVAVTYFARQ